MSYNHQMDQVRCDAGTGLTLVGTGIKARFLNTGLYPVVVAGAAILVEVVAGDQAVFTIRHRPTIASATGQTTIDTITLETTDAAGKVVYVTGLDTKVLPGEEVVFDLTDAAASGTVHCVLMTKPSWEQPANITDMRVSA